MKLKIVTVLLGTLGISVLGSASVDGMLGRYQQISANGHVDGERGRLLVRRVDGDQEIELFARLTDNQGYVCEINEIFEEREGSLHFSYQSKKTLKTCSLNLFRTPRGRLILKELTKPGNCQDLCLDERAVIGNRVFVIDKE